MTGRRRIDRVVEFKSSVDKYEQVRPPREQRVSQPVVPNNLRRWLERVDGRFMGTPTDVHPAEAILWAMKVSAGEATYCDMQIARLYEDELFERPTKTTVTYLPDGKADQITEVRDVEQISRWVRWRDHAMHRMAQYAKMALEVGIEERQVALAEKQAEQLVYVITAVLTDLGHDLNDMRTREIVRRRLMERAIEGTVVEGEESIAS